MRGRWGHPHHHHGHPRFRRMTPIGRFVRSRLRRKLFAWFALAILMTGGAAARVRGILSQGMGSGWRQDYERGRTWVGKQCALRWNSPAERDAFARESANELKVDLQLLDASGT